MGTLLHPTAARTTHTARSLLRRPVLHELLQATKHTSTKTRQRTMAGNGGQKRKADEVTAADVVEVPLAELKDVAEKGGEKRGKGGTSLIILSCVDERARSCFDQRPAEDQGPGEALRLRLLRPGTLVGATGVLPMLPAFSTTIAEMYEPTIETDRKIPHPPFPLFRHVNSALRPLVPKRLSSPKLNIKNGPKG